MNSAADVHSPGVLTLQLVDTAVADALKKGDADTVGQIVDCSSEYLNDRSSTVPLSPSTICEPQCSLLLCTEHPCDVAVGMWLCGCRVCGFVGMWVLIVAECGFVCVLNVALCVLNVALCVAVCAECVLFMALCVLIMAFVCADYGFVCGFVCADCDCV